MATEIERKFRVINDSYRGMVHSQVRIVQGYLSTQKEATVRVRLIESDGNERGYLTVKGVNRGAVRGEWEYEIPAADARQLLELSRSRIIDKMRYIVPYAGMTWEVDEFGGDHAGLVLAEVELPTADTAVELPPFVGDEVTGDAHYYNSTLAQ